MQQIFDELQLEGLDYNVEILGVNWNYDNESENNLMTEGRNIPWLQDTTAENVRQKFEAGYRDVIILDGLNREAVPRFNLSTYDLISPVNQGALKELLRIAATMVDTDNDGIADDWEERFLGGLDQTPGADTDLDGDDHTIEYGLGSDPGNRSSVPELSAEITDEEGTKKVSITFRRRLGVADGLKYILESSADGQSWADAADSFALSGVVNPYDGTGTEIVTYKSTGGVANGTLYRVRVVKESE